jgi:hypothetical protein
MGSAQQRLYCLAPVLSSPVQLECHVCHAPAALPPASAHTGSVRSSLGCDGPISTTGRLSLERAPPLPRWEPGRYWELAAAPPRAQPAGAFPSAHQRRAPTPCLHPTPRNIALAPFRASPRGLRRVRLAKRSIAPSRPTARCALSLAGGGVGAEPERGAGTPPEAPPPGPSFGRIPPRPRRAGAGSELRACGVSLVTVEAGSRGCPGGMLVRSPSGAAAAAV